MNDGVIKGTGNSRYLKSVSNALTLYPTHESLMEALASGTLPIDLNGINPAGWETQGTALNKANLLTDSTATGMGLTAAATPNQALAKLSQIVKEKGNTEIVSYDGTGACGAGAPCNISFTFSPKVIIWLGLVNIGKWNNSFLYQNANNVVLPQIVTTGYTKNNGFCSDAYDYIYGKKSADGKHFLGIPLMIIQQKKIQNIN